MKKQTLFYLLFSIFYLLSFCKVNAQDTSKITLQWKNLFDGIDICESPAPQKSIVGDSKITIVRIDPDKFEFSLVSSSEFGKTNKTVDEWAKEFDFNIVINAGMYDLSNNTVNRGFMQNYTHFNNPVFNPSYNMVIAFNPKDSLLPKFRIIDLTCESWDSIKNKYNSFSQGMRMIDCNGKALSWNKRKQKCSMMAASIDEKGNVYFIFCRSPYTQNEFIGFIKLLPIALNSCIYLEGGPETSLYVSFGEAVIQQMGSYVSDTYENDDNNHFWELPNVIGLKQIK